MALVAFAAVNELRMAKTTATTWAELKADTIDTTKVMDLSGICLAYNPTLSRGTVDRSPIEHEYQVNRKTNKQATVALVFEYSDEFVDNIEPLIEDSDDSVKFVVKATSTKWRHFDQILDSWSFGVANAEVQTVNVSTMQGASLGTQARTGT